MMMLMGLFLGGCVTAQAIGTTEPEGSEVLEDTSWRFVRFEGGDGTVIVPNDPTEYTVQFAGEDRLFAQVKCNRGQGSWSATEDRQLTLGPLALTRMMCPADPFQDRLVRDWEYVRTYLIREGNLYLSLFADGGIYELEPM
jgi:heat shock protein HslJ